MNSWHLVRCYIIAGSRTWEWRVRRNNHCYSAGELLHNPSHRTVIIISTGLTWPPVLTFLTVNWDMQSRNITLFMKMFKTPDFYSQPFLSRLTALNCGSFSQIWETFYVEFCKLRRLSENRFSPRTCFCWGKVFDGHKNSRIVQLCFAAEKRKLEFMSRKRKSYLGKVVENSSLLCAVAANVGRQFGEFFNRSLLLLRFNLNLPPLSSQSLFASLGSIFTFSPIFEEKSRCHPWLWVFCVII